MKAFMMLLTIFLRTIHLQLNFIWMQVPTFIIKNQLTYASWINYIPLSKQSKEWQIILRLINVLVKITRINLFRGVFSESHAKPQETVSLSREVDKSIIIKRCWTKRWFVHLLDKSMVDASMAQCWMHQVFIILNTNHGKITK